MTRKKVQRNIRLPKDVEDDVQRLADYLHSVGLLPDANWTGALMMVLMQAKRAGMFETPPAWLARLSADAEPDGAPKPKK